MENQNEISFSFSYAIENQLALRYMHFYRIKAIDHTFYCFPGTVTHKGCWENTQNNCKPQDRDL